MVFAVMGMIQAVGFGMGMGTGSIISRSLGAKENERAEKFAASGFLIAAFLGLILMTTGLIALRPLMELLGATQTILPYCEEYAKYILLGAPVMVRLLCAVLYTALRGGSKIRNGRLNGGRSVKRCA